MSAYIVVDLKVIDKSKLADYASAVPETLAPYEGQLLYKGQVTEHLNENGTYTHQACIAFDNAEKAKAWYQSPAYQKLIPTRDSAIESHFRVVN